MNKDIWVIGTSDQLFARGSYNEFPLIAIGPFVLSILFVLIILLSNMKQYSSFLKKVLVFQKTCFKVKTLKLFKISSDR